MLIKPSLMIDDRLAVHAVIQEAPNRKTRPCINGRGPPKRGAIPSAEPQSLLRQLGRRAQTARALLPLSVYISISI